MHIKNFLVIIVVFVCLFCIYRYLENLKRRKDTLYCINKVRDQLLFILFTWIGFIWIKMEMFFNQTDNFTAVVFYFLLYCFSKYLVLYIIGIFQRIFEYHHSERRKIEQIEEISYLWVQIMFAGYYLYRRQACCIYIILHIGEELKFSHIEKEKFLRYLKESFMLFAVSVLYLLWIILVVLNNSDFLRDYLIGTAVFLIFKKIVLDKTRS